MVGAAGSDAGSVYSLSGVASTSLTDQDGRTFRFSPLRGRILVLNFIFTGCSSTCPLQTRKVVEAQQGLPAELRNQVHFVSMTIDPLNDTPEVLKDFALKMGADLKNWSFVTGSRLDIDMLSAQMMVFDPRKKAPRPADHSALIWLIDGEGRVMQRYSSDLLDSKRLMHEITQLHAMKRGGA